MSITTSAQQIIKGEMSPRIPERYWEVINQYRDRLLNQAHSIVGSREDAEDVVQETFCEAFRDGQKLSAACSIGTWLQVINHRNAVDKVRHNKSDTTHKSARLKAQHSEKTLTTGGFSALELRDSVSAVLAKLPRNLRTVVQLRFWEHLSYKEIADRLHVPVGSVSGLLLEASLHLYDKLHNQAGKTGAGARNFKSSQGNTSTSKTNLHEEQP